MAAQKIRIVIADGQELFRRGLVAILNGNSGFEVVGEAYDGQEAVDKVGLLAPEVLIIDVQMPLLDGISVCRRIRQLYPRTEILFLSNTHEERQMREAFESGARAYLPKDCSLDELLLAVRKAAMGDYYLSGPASQDMVNEYVKPLLRDQRAGGLMTQRERELARLLSDGYSTKEAADILNISPKTAETHRTSIMKKLNAKNVTDIVKYCIRNRIIEP
jgi:DNA-binding NarL/FixJ family response regulator